MYDYLHPPKKNDNNFLPLNEKYNYIIKLQVSINNLL